MVRAFAIVSIILLLRNPQHKYYRMASALLGIFGTLNLLPALDTTRKITESNTANGWKEIFFNDSPMVGIALLGLTVYVLHLDFKKNK